MKNNFLVKQLDLQVVDISEEIITLEGFASLNTLDGDEHIVAASVWEDPETFKRFRQNPILLSNHRHDKPIGMVTDFQPDPSGLKITAEITTAMDPTLAIGVKNGLVKGLSIGFRPLDIDFVDNFVTITKLELVEISVVAIPSNPDTLFEVKSLADSIKLQGKDLQLPRKDMSNEVEIENKIAKALHEIETRKEQERIQQERENQREKNLQEAITKSISSGLDSTITETVSAGLSTIKEDIQTHLKDEMKSLIGDKLEEGESVTDAVAELRKTLANITNSGKARHTEGSNEGKPMYAKDLDITPETIRNVVLLGSITKKGITGTKYYKNLMEKSRGFNAADALVDSPNAHGPNDIDWETEFASQIFNEVRQSLVVFNWLNSVNTVIPMTSAVWRAPIEPDQPAATYVPVDAYKTSGSTVELTHNRLTQISLHAHKLTAKTYLGLEEEEDSIIPLLGLVQARLVRSMAIGIDRSLLIGVGTTAADPTVGVVQHAINDNLNGTQLAVSGTATVVGTLLPLRKALGRKGLNPRDIVYIVSMKTYYDLLSDEDFRSVDKVGNDRSVLITGEMGSALGSRILISEHFVDTPAIGNPFAVAVYGPSFLLGEQRSLTIRTDELIEQDKRVVVATERVGMTRIETDSSACAVYIAD